MVQDHLVSFNAHYSEKYRHDANSNGMVDIKVKVSWELRDLESVFRIMNINFWLYLYCYLENPNF